MPITANGNLNSFMRVSGVGPQGPQGVAGDTGAQGSQGPSGATGSSYYDISMSYSGTPSANEEILRHSVVRPFTMPATGHKGTAYTAPSGGSVSFTVLKNGSQIGIITFNNGVVTATLSSWSSTSFAAGDYITINAPGTLRSIANIGLTLIGTI